jgi:hypothetical protein
VKKNIKDFLENPWEPKTLFGLPENVYGIGFLENL